MSQKKIARMRRAKKARMKISVQGVDRLTIHRTSRHMYAQVVSHSDGKIVACASTLEKELREGLTGNVSAAVEVGKLVASRAIGAGITKVAFDRAGFKYHGRVKALADAAREKGLQF